ncbi:Fer1 [Bugula neritina]|uniref:Fer1 n=1 Tax=Bugula neritina TaxID=10212 RepID=A0A7J7J0B0_BUGNE|nr:Fer1 [Bugula neritina]
MEVNNFAFHSSYPQSWDAELEFLNCWVQDEATQGASDYRLRPQYRYINYSEGDSDTASSPVEEGSPVWSEELGLNYSTSLYEEFDPSGVTTSDAKKKPHRTAANQRERKRMKSINDAFDDLRQYIPLPVSERSKLSKVDTLKYAIMYIGNMTETLQQYEDTLYYRKKKHSEAPKKVVLKCKRENLQQHALSWCRLSKDVTRKNRNSNRVTTRLWIPQLPSVEDMTFLSNADTTSYPDQPVDTFY